MSISDIAAGVKGPSNVCASLELSKQRRVEFGQKNKSGLSLFN